MQSALSCACGRKIHDYTKSSHVSSFGNDTKDKPITAFCYKSLWLEKLGVIKSHTIDLQLIIAFISRTLLGDTISKQLIVLSQKLCILSLGNIAQLNAQLTEIN